MAQYEKTIYKVRMVREDREETVMTSAYLDEAYDMYLELQMAGYPVLVKEETYKVFSPDQQFATEAQLVSSKLAQRQGMDIISGMVDGSGMEI
jgi:hypothetical protein